MPESDNPFRKPPPGWGTRGEPPVSAPRPAAPAPLDAPVVALEEQRAAAGNPAFTPPVIGRAIGLLILTWLTGTTIAAGLTYPRPGSLLMILDGANFIIHEAGHFIFIVFGEFMMVFGGSLNQVLVPAIFTGYFFAHRQTGQAAATLFWMGQSMTGVALYAADGQVMRLPLHGGEGPAVHDWHRLLTWTGLLERAATVGQVLFAIAALIMVAALVILVLDLLRAYREPERVFALPPLE
jgi:hypothetical protein